MKMDERTIQNNQQRLEEMAIVCREEDGYGIVIELHSGDHNPPHAHLLDSSSREYLGKFEITDNAPRDIEDVTDCDKKQSIPSWAKEAVVDWAKADNKKLRINNWDRLNIAWDILQP
jgi:hypothetical protein